MLELCVHAVAIIGACQSPYHELVGFNLVSVKVLNSWRCYNLIWSDKQSRNQIFFCFNSAVYPAIFSIVSISQAMQHRAEKITDRMIFWRNCSDLLFKDCSAGLVASLRSSSLLSWTFQRQSKRSSPKQPRLLSTAPAPIYCVWTLSYAPIIVGLYKVRLYSSSDRTLRLCYEPGDIFVSINDILFVNFNLILLESW